MPWFQRWPVLHWLALPWALLPAIPAARAACDLQQLNLPVHIVDHRPVTTVRLNGTEVKMLVDSGAFFSMLIPSTAEQLKLKLRQLPWDMHLEGYTGRIEAHRTIVDKMGLLNAELSGIEFLVGGNELGAGIGGFLGRNVLAVRDAEYDLAHGVVRLTIPKGECSETNMAYWAGQAPVIEAPLLRDGTPRGTSILVEVRINGQRMKALLDTGAVITTVALKAARRAGLQESALTPTSEVSGAGEGSRKSWFGKFASFELGGQKITNAQLRVADVDIRDHDVLIGLDYFLAHRIYVAYSQRQLYATWNGDQVFDPDPNRRIAHDGRYAALPPEPAADDADALARRGAAALARNDPTRALADLDRACELAPGVALNFYMRARVHVAMQQYDLALPDLDRALQLDPALAEARLRRAWMRALQLDRPGALQDLTQLDQSLPPAAHTRADMGELYRALGLLPEAYRQYGLWIGTHPDDERRKTLMEARCAVHALLPEKPARPPEGCKAGAAAAAAPTPKPPGPQSDQ